MQLEEMAQRFKEAGYNRVEIQKPDKHRRPKRAYIYAYDVERGVKLTYTSPTGGNNRGDDGSFAFCVRRNGSYSRVQCSKQMTLALGLKTGATFSGEARRGKKLKGERMLWRTTTLAPWVEKDNEVIRNVSILRAVPWGVCTIDDTGSCVFDVSAPGIEPYFVAQCWDLRNREFYIVFQDDKQFLIALRRGNKGGKPLLKIVADQLLWDTGPHALDVRNLTVEDLKMAYAATALWSTK